MDKRDAPGCWATGLAVAAVCLPLFSADVVEKVAYSMALGALVAALTQTIFYLALRRRLANPEV